jgi:outer membrane lipoprotein-sorting protein
MNWFWQFCCAATASVLLLTAPQAAIAAPAPPVPLTAQDSAELQRIAAYLQGIRTMTAKFHQAVAKGGDATGNVWVARPGKMRFQYDPPNELLMLADAFYIYSWDPELKSMNKVGLRSTPAWFLLRDPISFTGDVAVTRFEHSGNTVRVSVVQAAEPDQGSLTMEFTENPLVLRQWVVVDQKGRATTVALSDVQFGMALDPKLFQYQDPYSR